MDVTVFYPGTPYDKKYEEDLHGNNGLEKYVTAYNYPPYNNQYNKREEFLQLVDDSNSKMLMSWRGGRIENNDYRRSSYELIKMMTEADWEMVKNSSKTIIGYSDTSYLLCALISRGINCYYGPNYNTTLQRSSPEELQTTLDYLSGVLEADSDYAIDFLNRRLTADVNLPWIFREGKASGRLVGGNLDTIIELIYREGADYLAIEPGDILFLEENGPTYMLMDGEVRGSMYSNLAYLRDAGILSSIGGLIIGRSNCPKLIDYDSNCYEEIEIDNTKEKDLLKRNIEEFCLSNKPILANVACGHTHPMVTLPLGKTVTLDSKEQTLTIGFE